VDAPEGTAARPMIPHWTDTSTSTVGLPRESNISLAYIFSIAEFNNYSRKLDNQIRFDRKHHSIAITQFLQIGTTQRVIH
jgi:hypothetical protein